ncbi:MAG: leuD [Deltaproteobacteria bacterium]|jgi:3-isopropylmalate/(R)-2-methylmalate dehydratase small subunit|nr:leuD [Deltaproteobacteria bacterium]MBP2685952.1 leuD [Deltaproteobacteria bacterium]
MREKFLSLSTVGVPLDRMNVDTDAIIPARYLKTIKRTGLGEGLFFAWRYDRDGKEQPDFPLNRPEYRGGKVLVAGENFGCGSSREHAVWALMDFGFRAVIAPSYSDIFRNNCLKNGMLPVTLPAAEVRSLLDALSAAPGSRVEVDLPGQTVRGPRGDVHPFRIDPFAKTCLLEGLDEIALTLASGEAIDRYERERRKVTPWLFQDLAG